jgi:peptide/nickel transport system substrate-binding protein
MLRNRLLTVLGLVLIASMVLSACGTPTPAATEAPAATAAPAVATEAPAATAVPAPTAEPTKVPVTRKGGWLDEVVFSVVAKDSAVTQLQAGAIDVYAGGLASADLPTIKAADLKSADYNGLYYDIMYNPAVFTDTNVLNPFSDRKIREATNMLYDRNYINQEVYAGGGLAKFFAIQTNGPDYADLADVARGLESKYAYNLDKAKQIISDEMIALGATAGADGKWMFKDKPVTLTFLIRPDSDGTRKPIGDYVATQLEKVGFTVDRQYKKSSEASPLWLGTAGAEGKWNLYTAAWSSTVISRDDKGQFQQMYLPGSVQGSEPFISNTGADPAFKQLGDDLANAKFTTLAERRDMMVKAMSLSLEDSLQVWLIDGKNYAPYVKTVQATGDLAAGLEGAQVWPYTVRFADKEGGQLKWGEPDLFAEPWNPIAGSNWAFDQAAIRATSSGDTMNDPYTGLVWPLRIEKAEVTVLTGLPVGKTLNWVTLKTADKIDVPADAWAEWDAKAQTFVPAGEGKTAKRKTVVTYPADMFKTVKWHDGSPLTVGDFVMGMIMTFDRANKDSAIYDEANAKPVFDSFIQAFKGFKITSKDPLVIEYYSDSYLQDAELNVPVLWPAYGYGEGSWAMLAVANSAEAAGEIAYSSDKAGADAKKPIEQTSFIGGPSLEILSKYLDKAATDKLIPYAPTMSQFVTADEAATRYANLKAWYAAHGHFWVGTGPYLLDKVFLTEKSLTLKNFADFPDLADRWSNFGQPKLAEVALDGPGQVKIGDEAVFNIAVTFQGAPYANADIKQVKYLLYNAKGEVVSVGEAVAGADGAYTVTLGKDITAKLEAGSNKIEVAVVPLPVSVPTFTSMEFVTAP